MKEINTFEGQSLHFFAAVLLSVLGMLWVTMEVVQVADPASTSVQNIEQLNSQSDSTLTARQIH